ncbi:synaptic vesicle membrane protein VAT-1 homolog-like [Planococcus citri]|uniref:synaptic vesicle membrane protein VAT-1 homolog-like n=1 Tax=Planococcus citri TaxID=170843 RepID=UPI0031F78FB6
MVEIVDEKKPEQQNETPKEAEKAENNAEKTPEEPPKEMRSVVLTSFGGLKSVKILKKPEPAIGADDVLIRVKACGLNFQDLMVRQGAIDSLPKTPIILGFECSGDIEQVGENVKDFKVGDKVVALPEFKAWAELVVVPSKYVFAVPSNMSYHEAAAITMNYIVAYILLFELGHLSEGKSVLFHSAGGGVGQALIQLSKTIPDVKIFGVASKNKHEALQNVGITHLLERGNDYVSEVRKLAPEGIDLVLDCLCGEECNRGYSLLKPMGKYILYGSANVVTGETKSIFSVAKSWWQVDKVSPVKLFEENKTIAGFNLRHLLYQQNKADYVKGILDKVFDLWKESKIAPIIDSKWALEDVSEAMQKMHDRKNVGKLVLDPSLEPKPKPATPLKTKGKSIDKEDKDKKKEEENTTNGTTSPPEAKEEEKKTETTTSS